MKILLTGSTGYIGRRLLPLLVDQGHQVVCPVRDQRRFDFEDFTEEFLRNIEVIEVDFSKPATVENLPKDIDAAYYFLHSLTANSSDFKQLEIDTATNFRAYVEKTQAKQVIYLGGIVNDDELSDHLASRQNVETILGQSEVPLTVLRSAIIIGSGGSSFEIIRDLVEKLPIMIAPKWLQSRCQPIAIANVLEYLIGVLNHPKALNKVFDIGGKDVLTYKQMLLQFGEIRGLKRWIITVPVLSIRLSSLWLYFVTSTSYRLASNLVDSMKNEVVCRDQSIDEIVSLNKLGYKEALQRTFLKIEQKQIISSWKDSIADPDYHNSFIGKGDAPVHGCFTDKRTATISGDPNEAFQRVWEIGGERGWYYGDYLWRLRGFIDLLVGGVGLRRGRRSPSDLKSGDALDFWRVLVADKPNRRLLLYAEMKLPGEAWLEFKVRPTETGHELLQTATFRPLGVWGRLYWIAVYPFHGPIFSNMSKRIARG